MGGRCITGGRFWGGKGLESEKDALDEKELLGVNIRGGARGVLGGAAAPPDSSQKVLHIFIKLSCTPKVRI